MSNFMGIMKLQGSLLFPSLRGSAYLEVRSFLQIILSAGVLLLAPVVSLGQGGGAIAGRVLDPAGAAIRGAKVTLRERQSGPDVLTTTTNEEGRFRFEGLSTGSYQLNISAENFNLMAQAIRLEEPARELEIELVPRGLDEFVTVTAGDIGYRAEAATTALRTDIALRDTPQSIQIVTKQVIEEQAAVTASDVLRNVSGVSVPNSSGGSEEDFTVRGFTSAGNTYKDGIRNDSNSNRAYHEFSNVERVEVLKGPASVLYGRLDPSGVVNMVTKRPLSDHYLSLTFLGGSSNFQRPQIDLAERHEREVPHRPAQTPGSLRLRSGAGTVCLQRDQRPATPDRHLQSGLFIRAGAVCAAERFDHSQ
jgi:outer membrane receptor protein involved in Fe transport